IMLYSCGGDGMIYEFDPKRPTKGPTNINTYIANASSLPSSSHQDNTPSGKTATPFPKRSDFAWKPTGDVIAIGNADGSIELFHYPSWRKLASFVDHRKLINRL